MSVSSNGWQGSPLAVAQNTSPNFRPRKAASSLKFIIIHGTWMASDADAIARLTDAAAEVSCHYYIDRAGAITQLVSEKDVAFHAGKSAWQGIEGLNEFSLGIEIGNAGPFKESPTPETEKNPQGKPEPYTEVQYVALIKLLKDLLGRNDGITPAGVLGHSDVSPGRKSDPGAHFDWQRLVAAGVCVRPTSA